MKSILFSAAIAAMSLTAAPVIANEAAMAARHGEMRLLAHSLGVLGGMAKGQIEYDKLRAEVAADTLVAVTSIDQSMLWPEGTETGTMEGSSAKPEIWGDKADFTAKWEDLHKAAQTMKTAAGEGQQAIGAAMGDVGGACSACHKVYRVSKN
ncbi:c-type cytochrome [Chachezhania antarctica]|uniref:c-type cytochrome n=1 Tax=Chachezhania antarctica TaxID=2340860 RepID=UPI000EB07C26|nr:cytochrome c [Chachezhania antarctica]|tara:strand:+ start:4347 stop:4802 length:456 start_codon:yes stop_codon:yes gene_type:complete